MTLLAFAAVWLATWAACWFVLALVWTGKKHHFVVVDRTNGGMTTRWWDRKGGAREWAGLAATVVTFLLDLAIGG